MKILGIILSVLLFCSAATNAQTGDSLRRAPADTVKPLATDTLPALPDTSLIGTFPLDSANKVINTDTVLRIINLNPYFTLHVDSTLSYQLQINKNADDYFWFLRNSPVGLRINKDNGTLTFNANKSLFLSGRLKYDVNYNVNIGVQNLKDPSEKIDTSFTIVFYSTEIIPSVVKPSVSQTLIVEEGQAIDFSVMCETGSFPIEHILTLTSSPISNYTPVQRCGDKFQWTPPYDLVKETDKDKQRIIDLLFIGSTKFQSKDTATVRLIIKDALNYPLALQEYGYVTKNVRNYIVQLKYTFLQLDKKIKKVKNVRTTFDLTSSTTSVAGTIMSSSDSKSTQKTGKVLPSIGLAMVPIKEATAPTKVTDQNQAAKVRSTIKRLEFMLTDNQLLGERDLDIVKKTNTLRDELKKSQTDLIDVPIDITGDMAEEELNRYFNSPKVNKKYRLRYK